MSSNFLHQSGKSEKLALLDIGSHKISCFVVDVMQQVAVSRHTYVAPPSVKILGVGYHQSRGLRSGMITDMNAAETSVRHAVQAAEEAAGVVIEEVILNVTCGRVRSESFNLKSQLRSGFVEDTHMKELAQSALKYATRNEKSVLHLLSGEYALDGEEGIINPVGMSGQLLSSHMTAILADPTPLNNLVLCVEKAHLFPSMLVAAPYASGLAVLDHEANQANAMVLDMGAGSTNVAIYEKGTLVYVDTVAKGGLHLTKEIAQHFGIGEPWAERAKTLHSQMYVHPNERQILAQVDTYELSKLTRQNLAHLIDVIGERMKKNGRTSMSDMTIYLTGGSSQLGGLAPFIQEYTGVSTQLVRPAYLPGLPDQASGPEFASTIGLALYVDRLKQGKEIWVNQFEERGEYNYFKSLKEWFSNF